MCGTQPFYGKLSNIFGRKPLLLLSYVLFALGNLLCGLADNMMTVIVGRIVGGTGGAGMSSLVSFLIADMVPVRQVAAYRSYINVVQTIGRSCGGPLGESWPRLWGGDGKDCMYRFFVVADRFRSFYIQVPLTLVAITLVQVHLDVAKPAFHSNDAVSVKARLRRIDFLGALLMCTAIVTLLLSISMGGNQFYWTHPIVPALFVASVILAVLFAYVETRVTREPIFPLTLLAQRDVVLTYGILMLQNAAQTFVSYIEMNLAQSTSVLLDDVRGSSVLPSHSQRLPFRRGRIPRSGGSGKHSRRSGYRALHQKNRTV